MAESDDVHFWIFVIICFVAVFMFFDLQKGRWRSERYDGLYRMDPTDVANPSPNNIYVSLAALQEAEQNFSPDTGPYLM